jgi:hypothetical protein
VAGFPSRSRKKSDRILKRTESNFPACNSGGWTNFCSWAEAAKGLCIAPPGFRSSRSDTTVAIGWEFDSVHRKAPDSSGLG